VTLPKHEGLVTLITRWVNNRQQPDGFYRDLLSRTLGVPEGELFDNAPQVVDLTAGAEPWHLRPGPAADHRRGTDRRCWKRTRR
jgi:hypothetical protein